MTAQRPTPAGATAARRLDRRALFSTAAAAALLAASGVSAGAPRHGGRLRMALSGASRSDDWQAGAGLFMQVARQGLVFDTLTELAADGTLRGELARGWTPSDDARVWTFDLRPGVTFHDGTAFTAADVVASLSATLSPQAMRQIKARGALRVEMRFATPLPDLPLVLARPDHVIRPAHAPAAGIGTGLYRVVHFTPGQRLLTRRVDSHYKDGQAGWFDEVELTSIPADRVRAQALAEYLVDAIDLPAGAAPGTFSADLPDVVFLPDARRPRQAVSRDLAQPAQISSARPLDDLRAGERWWFA